MSLDLIAILDEIPIGICLMNKEGRIVLMNRALEALTGFSRTECKGLRCAHVLGLNYGFENSPLKKMENFEKCVLEGDIINQENRKIPVRVTFAPLLDKKDEISGFIFKIVEHAAGLNRADRADLGHLPAYLTEGLADLRAEDGGQRTEDGGQRTEDGSSTPSGIRHPASDVRPEGFDWSSLERKMILDALLKVKGRRSKAAQLLGWGRSTLWRKMRHYGIAAESVRVNKKLEERKV